MNAKGELVPSTYDRYGFALDGEMDAYVASEIKHAKQVAPRQQKTWSALAATPDFAEAVDTMRRTKKGRERLKLMVREGIPSELRAKAWLCLSGADAKQKATADPTFYTRLLESVDQQEKAARAERQSRSEQARAAGESSLCGACSRATSQSVVRANGSNERTDSSDLLATLEQAPPPRHPRRPGTHAAPARTERRCFARADREGFAENLPGPQDHLAARRCASTQHRGAHTWTGEGASSPLRDSAATPPQASPRCAGSCVRTAPGATRRRATARG